MIAGALALAAIVVAGVAIELFFAPTRIWIARRELNAIAATWDREGSASDVSKMHFDLTVSRLKQLGYLRHDQITIDKTKALDQARALDFVNSLPGAKEPSLKYTVSVITFFEDGAQLWDLTLSERDMTKAMEILCK